MTYAEKALIIKATRLASVMIDTLPDSEVNSIYDCLRSQVFGLPSGAIRAEDVLYAMAQILGYRDPSEPDGRNAT